MSDIMSKIQESICEFIVKNGRDPSVLFLNHEDRRQLFYEAQPLLKYSFRSSDQIKKGIQKFQGLQIRMSEISCVGNVLDLNQGKEK